MQNPDQGRALSAAPIYHAPNPSSEIIATLWPDSVSHIRAVDENWYLLSNGYVERGEMQPMYPREPMPELQIPVIPFWAEVVGPVAPIREYCAADAPLITRIGHGGVIQVVDYLPDGSNAWYGISDDQENLTGWTQAIHWLPIVEISPATHKTTISIDVVTQLLSVQQNGTIAFQAPCSLNPDTKPGIYFLEQIKPGGPYRSTESAEIFHGAPWQLKFGEGTELIGAYWHNQFGKALLGPAVQVSPQLARWLYSSMSTGDQMIVA